MSDQTKDPFGLQTREYVFRAESIDTEKGIVRGVAVPYDSPVRIREWWGDEYEEQFARGSVDDDGALAFWRHDQPIGKLISAVDGDTGREVSLQISRTSLGADALTLARDGVVSQLSVGFEPGGDYEVTERDGDVPLITRTKVRVREISLVPFGAYGDGAAVTEVRSRPNPTQKENTVTDTAPAPDLTEVRESIEDLERRMATFSVKEETPAVDTRSAAEVMKALRAGDESTIRSYNEIQERAYTGGTSADTVLKDGWVGDLTRIFDNSSGVLAAIFGTGTLPKEGAKLEYGQLKSNTTSVTKQAAEGDDLAYGKVVLESKTADIHTYGGYVQLTRLEIERSSLPILNRSLEALSQAAGKRAKAELRTAFNALKTEREAIAAGAGVVLLGATLAAGTFSNWVNSIVDAAGKFDEEALNIDALIVSGSVFKKLAGLTGSDGRPMLTLDGTGANTVGRLNITALNGSLVGVPVVLDSGLSGDSASFADGRAIRTYNSPLVSLQDENIVNLSKDFSVYRYGAIAPEIPAGLVPVKLAAS